MTVTYLGEIPEARKAQNLRGVRTYSRAFHFSTSTDAEDAWDVGSHPNAPIIGSTFRDGYCISSTPQCVSGRFAWRIDAEYSSEYEVTEDPTAEPARITVSTEQFQKPAVVDKAGNKINNSAGDPFDPPLMIDDSRRVISVSKNLATHPSWILSYQDTVNSDSFTVQGITYTAGKGKLQRVSISNELSRNGTTYFVVQFEIHLQKNGWLLQPLDAGFRERDYSGDLINILNPGDSEEPSAPVPLDGSGSALDNPSFANNVTLSFDVYETAVFSALPLT
jgi:hypothetical protein